jgi:hypothetical protein
LNTAPDGSSELSKPEQKEAPVGHALSLGASLVASVSRDVDGLADVSVSCAGLEVPEGSFEVETVAGAVESEGRGGVDCGASDVDGVAGGADDEPGAVDVGPGEEAGPAVVGPGARVLVAGAEVDVEAEVVAARHVPVSWHELESSLPQLLATPAIGKSHTHFTKGPGRFVDMTEPIAGSPE